MNNDSLITLYESSMPKKQSTMNHTSILLNQMIANVKNFE
jgi:hypothetical protein